MLETLPLQAGAFCTGKAPTAHLLDFEFVKAIACTYGNSAGILVVGLLVYGGIAGSIFIRTGDIRIPVVLTLLTGGAILPQVAAPGVAIVGIALLLAGAASITLLYYRYSR
jgi:hypothetical protein